MIAQWGRPKFTRTVSNCQRAIFAASGLFAYEGGGAIKLLSIVSEQNIICVLSMTSGTISLTTILAMNIRTASKFDDTLNLNRSRISLSFKFTPMKNLSIETKLVPLSLFAFCKFDGQIFFLFKAIMEVGALCQMYGKINKLCSFRFSPNQSGS